MTYAAAMSFSRLNTLGLITHAQQDAAAAHSQRNVIGATASPAECLLWMVEKRIASHADLIEFSFDGPDDADDAYWDEMENIVEEVLSKCMAMSSRMGAALFVWTDAMPRADFDAMLVSASVEEVGAVQRLRLLQGAAAEIPRFRHLYGSTPADRTKTLHGGLRFLLGCAALVCGYAIYQFVNSGSAF